MKIWRNLTISLFVLAIAVIAMPALYASESETAKGSEKRAQQPTSVESAIERRRDLLERRREHYRDAMTGRRWRQPPWVNATDDWFERREEIMDERFRRRRDAAEARREAWERWQNPWSRWHRDIAEARRNARELERLQRDEVWDRLYFRRPW